MRRPAYRWLILTPGYSVFAVIARVFTSDVKLRVVNIPPSRLSVFFFSTLRWHPSYSVSVGVPTLTLESKMDAILQR